MVNCVEKIDHVSENIVVLFFNTSIPLLQGGAKKQGASRTTNQNKAQPPAKNKTITRAEKASKSPKKGTTHPIIPGKEIIADDSLSFYKVVTLSTSFAVFFHGIPVGPPYANLHYYGPYKT